MISAHMEEIRTGNLIKFFDYSYYVFVVIGDDGYFQYASNAFETLFGFAKNTTLLKRYSDFIHPEDLQAAIKEMGSIRSGEKSVKFEFRLLCKDGSYKWTSWDASRINDQIYAIGHDISELKKSQEKLREIDRTKSEFIYLVAHQLLAPLTAINWNIEAVSSGMVGDLNQKQKEFLNTIARSNQQLIQLIEEFLNVSKIDLGNFSIVYEEVNVSDILESAIENMEHEMNTKNLLIDKNLPSHLVYKTDKKILDIVLQNLISNAIKYTPEKNRINIEIGESNSELNITVSDTGYGIPENQKSKIFEKLFRADNVRIKGITGTGLGLYMVKSLLNKIGGKIWFESEENKGSIFHATIPIKK